MWMPGVSEVMFTAVPDTVVNIGFFVGRFHRIYIYVLTYIYDNAFPMAKK